MIYIKTITYALGLFIISVYGYAQDLPDQDNEAAKDDERGEVVCYAADDRWVCVPKSSERPELKTHSAPQQTEVEAIVEPQPMNEAEDSEMLPKPLDPPAGVEAITDTAPAEPGLNPMEDTAEDVLTEQSPQLTAPNRQAEQTAQSRETVSEPETVTPDYQGDNWFERYPEHWTIQILGVANQQNLAAYIEQKQLRDEDYRVVETRVSGAPWWVIIYGHYPNREAADRARNQLPAELSNGAWLRPLSSLTGE